MDLRLHPCSVDPAEDEDHEKCGPNRLSVSNSWSGRHWELNQGPAVGDRTDIVQLGTGHPCGHRRRSTACGPSTTRGCVPRGRRPDARRHATVPQAWMQREHWEFETHRVQQAQEYGVRVHLLGIKPARGSQSKFLLQEADAAYQWEASDLRSFLRCSPHVEPDAPPLAVAVATPDPQEGADASDPLEEVARQVADEVIEIATLVDSISSLARTMPTDRILTCRCDTTLVGQGRSSDSRSHRRGRPVRLQLWP